MGEQKAIPVIRTPEQKEAHKAYLKSLKGEQGEQGEQDKLLLTPEELKAELIKYSVAICQTKPPQMPNHTDMIWQCVKAQLAKAKQHNRFKKALEQSRKDEPLDLSEEEFELFSAIQNDGIAKHSHQNT